ncbi:hypothetical protein OBE_10538, partial [human gut metagenome]
QGLDKGETINSLTMIDVISRALNPILKTMSS